MPLLEPKHVSPSRVGVDLMFPTSRSVRVWLHRASCIGSAARSSTGRSTIPHDWNARGALSQNDVTTDEPLVAGALVGLRSHRRRKRSRDCVRIAGPEQRLGDEWIHAKPVARPTRVQPRMYLCRPADGLRVADFCFSGKPVVSRRLSVISRCSNAPASPSSQPSGDHSSASQRAERLRDGSRRRALERCPRRMRRRPISLLPRSSGFADRSLVECSRGKVQKTIGSSSASSSSRKTR